jgi:hypothetical protein
MGRVDRGLVTAALVFAAGVVALRVGLRLVEAGWWRAVEKIELRLDESEGD